MSMGMQGMFGYVPFSVSSVAVQTFKNVQINHEARYAVHDVIGEHPVPEYIGPGQKKISFTIQLRQLLGGAPALTVETLKNMQASGESYRLMLGPDYMGKYYLRSFTEQRQYFNADGASIATDVQLNLEEDRGFNTISTVLNVVKRIFS